MYPYYHPTSVVVIDDDSDFLQSFSFRFGDSWLCETFDNPNRALEFIKQRDAGRQHLGRFLTPSSERPEDSEFDHRDQLVGFRASEISELLGDQRRFGQVSVMVVDYDMPSMTGLDVCEKLNGLPIRKILLTGKVGREIAVKAFNSSLIDSFLEKQDPNLSKQLQEQVNRLQDAYFAGTTDIIASLHAMGDGVFLQDEVFRLMFKSLMNQYDVVEYYAIVNPLGVILGLENGQVMFLRIADEDELNAQIEIAESQGAPMELMMRLREGAELPCFPTETGYFDSTIADRWQQHLYRAHILPSNQRVWRYSLIDASALPGDILGKAVSYFDYKHSTRH